MQADVLSLALWVHSFQEACVSMGGSPQSLWSGRKYLKSPCQIWWHAWRNYLIWMHPQLKLQSSVHVPARRSSVQQGMHWVPPTFNLPGRAGVGGGQPPHHLCSIWQSRKYIALVAGQNTSMTAIVCCSRRRHSTLWAIICWKAYSLVLDSRLCLSIYTPRRPRYISMFKRITGKRSFLH